MPHERARRSQKSPPATRRAAKSPAAAHQVAGQISPLDVVDNLQDARPADILALQHKYGDRAVQRLLREAHVKAKLVVGPAHDSYEFEADRMAQQVLSMPAPAPARPPVRRTPEAELAQTKPAPQAPRRAPETEAGFEAGGAIESQLRSHEGTGNPLPADVRSYMEPRFGADFSSVRVHADGQADRLNRQLSAQAFTHGEDIYLAAGKYRPNSLDGRKLLAHELTHVVQQSGTRRLQGFFGGPEKEEWERGGGKTDPFSPTAAERTGLPTRNFLDAVSGLYQGATQKLGQFKQGVTTKWGEFAQGAKSTWGRLSESAGQNWNALKLGLGLIGAEAQSRWSAFREGASDKWGKLKQGAGEQWSGVQTGLGMLKGEARQRWGDFQEGARAKWGAVKKGAAAKWGQVKAGWGKFKTEAGELAANEWQFLKDTFTAKAHSRAHAGRATGKGWQEAAEKNVTEATEGDLDARARQLHEILGARAAAYASTHTRFNDVRFALAGNGPQLAERFHQVAREAGTKPDSLRAAIDRRFRSPLQREYLTNLIELNHVPEWLELAETAGLLVESLPPKSLSGRMLRAGTTFFRPGFGPGGWEQLVDRVRTISLDQLQIAETKLGKSALRAKLGERGYAIVKARLHPEAEVAKTARYAKAVTPKDSKAKPLDAQVEAADVETTAIVRLRRSKLLASHWRIWGTKGTLKTDKTKIIEELRVWALGKDKSLVNRLIDRKGRLHHELTKAFGFGLTDIGSSGSITFVYQVMQHPDASNPEHALKQVEAILAGRKASKWSLITSGTGSAAQINKILDRVNPHALQAYLAQQGGTDGGEGALKALQKKVSDAWIDGSLLDWIGSTLGAAENTKTFMDRLRFGEAGQLDRPRQRLEDLAYGLKAKLETGTVSRRGRRILTILQHDLKPGTADYELVRRDAKLLARIKGVFGKYHKQYWEDTKGILGITNDDEGYLLGSQEWPAFRQGKSLEARARGRWQEGKWEHQSTY